MKKIKINIFELILLCLAAMYIVWAVITQSPPYIIIDGKTHFTYWRSCELSLDPQYTDPSRLRPLKYMRSLRELTVHDIMEINDLEFLKDMVNLEKLTLDGHDATIIHDYSAIASCTQLKEFHSGYISIDDLSIFSDMNELEALSLCMYAEYIEGRDITDLTPLENLTKLRHIHLQCIGLTDISALSNLTDLENVLLHKSSITDLEPLRGLEKLKHLALKDDEALTDISVLEHCPALEIVWIDGTNVTDISALLSLDNLKTVYVDTDKIPAEQIKKLAAKGVSINERAEDK